MINYYFDQLRLWLWGHECQSLACYDMHYDIMDLNVDPRRVWLVVCDMIVADEWLATVQYASRWPGMVLEVLDVV